MRKFNWQNKNFLTRKLLGKTSLGFLWFISIKSTNLNKLYVYH